MLLCETFPVSSFQCNCTVLACPETKQAVVIDPGGGTRRIAAIIAHHDLSVRAIIHTHAHLDHIYCTAEVKQAHGGDIALHRADQFLYDGIGMQAAMFGWQPREASPIDRYVDDGDEITFGASAALVLHTPGHTPGSICFEVRDGDRTLVFSGDTLFQGSVGRTDLPGGDTRTLLSSIASKLYTRDPAAVVIPGHGPATTIEREAATNPFVRARL